MVDIPTPQAARPTATSAQNRRVDTEPAGAYPEALYAAGGEVARVADLASVDATAVASFHRDGFLSIEQAFDPAVIGDATAAIKDLIRGANPDFNNLMFEAGAADRPVDELTALERSELVRKLMNFCRFDPRLDRVLRDPAMLDVIEQIVGETPKPIQEMALLKPPGGGREKPWHQDLAYFDYAQGTPVVGVWIALDPAEVSNGCMHVVSGTHRDIVPHFRIRDWQVCDTHILGKPILAAPLPPGGALLFSGLLLHGTPTNTSDRRRRALQFHYTGASVEKVDRAVRTGLFGEEGRDVEC